MSFSYEFVNCDVTKQNGHTREGTLYREPLGKMVVHYDNVYKNRKRAEVWYAFKIFGLLSY